MDEILSAFTNKTIWAGIIMTFALQYAFTSTPKAIKAYLRGSKLRELRKIKAIRHNQDAVTFQSIKAHTYFLVFMGMSALFLVLLTMGPLTPLLKLPIWLLLLVISPVFITEILWLKQDMYSQRLIERRGNLRKSRQSKYMGKNRK